MIVPNKFTTLDHSLLAKAPKILMKLPNEVSIESLYEDLTDTFEDPGEFILTLDLLFVLGQIAVDPEKKVVTRC